MLLNILSGFTYNIMTWGFIFFYLGLIPLAFIIAFSGLDWYAKTETGLFVSPN